MQKIKFYYKLFFRRQGTVRQDGFGTPGLGGNAALHQVVHHSLEFRLIEALTQGVIELYSQAAVDGLELRLRIDEWTALASADAGP